MYPHDLSKNEHRRTVAVLFEVTPKPGYKDRYLELAAQLKNELGKMPGFISVERFASLTSEGKFLSLSFWESEETASLWRNHAAHQHSQKQGRDTLFSDYVITVAAVSRSYSLAHRDEAPADSVFA